MLVESPSRVCPALHTKGDSAQKDKMGSEKIVSTPNDMAQWLGGIFFEAINIFP
jgi:hypothetical protein